MDIYIVDDDADFAQSLDLMLTESGHSVTSFATASAFLTAAHDLAGGCVLLDLKLPDLDGLEVQSRIAEIGRHAVILLTGYGKVPDAVAAMKAGAVDFLGKPFSRQNLADALERAERGVEQLNLTARQTSETNKLTEREIEVLANLALGKSSKVVAFEMNLSVRTIDMHRARIMRKLQVSNISSALLVAREAGLI